MRLFKFFNHVRSYGCDEVHEMPSVQTRRNERAVLKLMRKLPKKYGFVPGKLVTDDSDLTELRPGILE